MSVYSRDQFRDHVARETPKMSPSEGLAAAIESPTGQLPLFVQAKDLKSAAKVLEGDRELTDRLDTDPPELEETHGYDQWSRYQTDDEVWEHKLWRAGHSIYGDDEPLRSDIRDNGLQKPIRLAGGPAWARKKGTPFPEGTVLNGHHRLAVMAEDHPEAWMAPNWVQGPTAAGSRGEGD